MSVAIVDFFTAKEFPVDKGNDHIIFCGSASIKQNGIAFNEIKLKYNKRTKKYLIQFPSIKGSDGEYRPAFCSITKETRTEIIRLIVNAATECWEQQKAEK